MPSLALAILIRAAVPVVVSGIPGDPEFAGLVKARRREMHAATRKLADGLISLDDWAEMMRGLLLEGHTRGAYFGRILGLQDEVVPELVDVLAGRAAMDGETFYLRGFLDSLKQKDPRYWDAETKQWIEDRIDGRQDMYLGKLRGTANAAFLRSSPVASKFAWRLGGAEDHCEECPEYAAWGFLPEQEWPTHPGDSDTPCRYNCKCHLQRDDDVTGFKPVEL